MLARLKGMSCATAVAPEISGHVSRKRPAEEPEDEQPQAKKCKFLEQQTETVARLLAVFPSMEPRTLASTLERCSGDVDEAIRVLSSLSIREEGVQTDSEGGHSQGDHSGKERSATAERDGNQSAGGTLEQGGVQKSNWARAMVKEVTASQTADEAEQRTMRGLSAFEEQIKAAFINPNDPSREDDRQSAESLRKENALLKRAVAVQYQRYQAEVQQRDRHIEELGANLSRCQEELRNAQVSNYALSLHLRRAMDGNPFPHGSSDPDVF